jgi:hypothetical protein
MSHVIQHHLSFCVKNKPNLLFFLLAQTDRHIQLVWHHLSVFVVLTLPNPTVVFQFCLVFIWILLTLAGEVIEDFLRHERGEHDVTATPSEPIIQTETVLTHHLVNGGGKPLSRLTLTGRI